MRSREGEGRRREEEREWRRDWRIEEGESGDKSSDLSKREMKYCIDRYINKTKQKMEWKEGEKMLYLMNFQCMQLMFSDHPNKNYPILLTKILFPFLLCI